jgi:sugar phosphate permease
MCDYKKDRKCRACMIAFMVSFIASLSLIIAGFLVPPMGVIDGSVLTAVGELIAFPALAFGLRAVEMGYDAHITHGNTSIDITND